MDTIRAQLLRIQQQLSGLSASQKMLTASLLAIMLMTIMWWGRFAGTAAMEPVLDQSLPPETVGQIQAALTSHGIKASVVGDRVMVPADKKLEAVAMLAYNNALPTGGVNVWDEMIKMMSPWDTKPKTDAIHNHLRERMLSQAMTSFFPGVARANVLINSVSERRIGARIDPSASVQITTRGGERNTRALVEGVASTVASAVPGLKRSHVSIVIDGMLHRPHDPDAGFLGGDLYEQIAMLEKSNSDKIARMMPENSLVAVKVDVETSISQATREAYDETTTLVKEKSSETLIQESGSSQSSSGDPGAIPNTGAANSELSLAGSQSGPTNSTEKNRVENEILPGKTHEVIHKPAGKPTVISAAVRIPRSYFVRKFKQSNPTSSNDPDDATLQPLIEQLMPGYLKTVKACTDIPTDEAVSMDVYDDFGTLAVALSDTSAGSSAIGAMVGAHAREIALGVLAVVSLFMVSMIVRKGPQPAAVIESEQVAETPTLQAGEDLAGIVGGEASATLDGMELDEDSIKAQQVVHQVSTMVKEDPDAAANLVKRWLNRS